MNNFYLSKNRYDGLNLLSDLNDTFFKNFTRMSREDIAILLEMIKPKIARKTTFLRQAIPTTRSEAGCYFAIFSKWRFVHKLTINNTPLKYPDS